MPKVLHHTPIRIHTYSGASISLVSDERIVQIKDEKGCVCGFIHMAPGDSVILSNEKSGD
jgi:hypothetical protein